MKILFYSRGFASVGGIETLAKNLLSFLSSKGHDCRLVCWGKRSPLLESIEQNDIKVIRTFWRWGCKWNLPDWVLLPFGRVQVKKCDVILFGKGVPVNILRALRRSARKNTKFVYITAYRPTPPETDTEKEKDLLMLNSFDLVLVQATIFKHDLREIGFRKQIEVLPLLPRPANIPKPLSIESELKIGFLGRFVEDKNVPLLINAFNDLLGKIAQHPLQNDTRKVSLHLFGDGPLRKKLLQQVDSLGLNDQVFFHGNIPNDEIDRAISSCHLFAFSSLVEGQCLAALEILSCGRPIVTTEAGAFPEILSEKRFGLMVQNATPATFSDALLQMKKLLQENIVNAEGIYQAYHDHYSTEKLGNKYEVILKSLKSDTTTRASMSICKSFVS
jgi:glycosyltransferase involved in cell wall biosynthesis